MSKKTLIGSAAVVATMGLGTSMVLAATNAGHTASSSAKVSMVAGSMQSSTGTQSQASLSFAPHWRMGPIGTGMQGIAKDLNLSPSTLQTDLKSGKTLAQIAESQGVTSAQLISELESAAKAKLDDQVSSGKMTSARESDILSRMDKRISNFVNSKMPTWGDPAHGRGMGPIGTGMQGIAKDLNLSPSTLQTDLKSGKTLAQIAESQGVTSAQLISELESAAKAKLDGQVSSGKMTSARESDILSRMDKRISNFVNGKMPTWGDPAHERGMGPIGTGMLGIAKDLNLSPSTLQTDLKSGKTLAQIAESQGVTSAQLISELESAAKAKLDGQVSSGKMTSARESDILSRMDKRISNLVNGKMPTWGSHATHAWGARS
ncbi:hypothetical protein FY534_05460 [Alicyclobacillus sp. TC]|uniref:hypothetical protein n=1 Tax=Alicyclobacillus sp. TC TaxID=2606450 RepID=UPI0019332DA4|nr:hypothetical protein [Alicyclobacillus sp. TC]QRF23178.1 hypothetical protein FY534_05460 [Alicyclobacillus sp. TC]